MSSEVVTDFDKKSSAAALEKKLQCREDKGALQNRNILPGNVAASNAAAAKELEKNIIETKLSHALQGRPDKKDLTDRNILKEGNPALIASAQALEKARLEDQLAGKLKNRPSPSDEIIQKIQK